MSTGEQAAEHFRFSRFLHGYAKGKTRWDPAYPAVAEILRKSPHALLDIGCGVGLLAAYLREAGCRQRLLGIEPDANKVDVAMAHIAPAYPHTEFVVGDARALPEFSGDVVMLDVLHYMDRDGQMAVLRQVASRVAPGGCALIRTTFRDRSWRYYATMAEEVVVRVSGWIRGGCCQFPTRAEVLAPFSGSQWTATVRPMWGRTPFNSHLIEIRRR